MKKYEKIDLASIKETIDKLKPNRQALAKSLYKEIDFMQDTLDNLKAEVVKNGVITKMEQGSYTIDRANPSLQQYNTLIKNYANCIKQLQEILKDANNDLELDDSLDEWLSEEY